MGLLKCSWPWGGPLREGDCEDAAPGPPVRSARRRRVNDSRRGARLLANCGGPGGPASAEGENVGNWVSQLAGLTPAGFAMNA